MSRIHPSLRAAVSAALLVSCAAIAPAAAAPVAQTGRLPSGVAYTIQSDPAQTAAAVALWFRAPSGGFDERAVPGMSRVAASTVTASAPVTGTTLAQFVSRLGGRLAVSSSPDSVSVTALVPPDAVPAVVKAMTADFFAPVVTAAGLESGRNDIAAEMIVRSFEPDAIEDAVGSVLFADGPVHAGTISAPQALRAIDLARVRTFAERAFRPSNAVLVLTGNTAGADALAQVASRAGAAGDPAPERPAADTPRTSAAAAPATRTANIAGTGLGWIGPPIADEAAATALDFVADALFTPRTGIVSRAIAGRKASVTGKFVTYRDPGVFVVTITGDDADAVRPAVEKAVADAAKPLDRRAFESARAAFIYHLLAGLQSPNDLADSYGWYTVEGAPQYAPGDGGAEGRYFTHAAALTPGSVARAAAAFLGRAPAVVHVVKASEQQKASS